MLLVPRRWLPGDGHTSRGGGKAIALVSPRQGQNSREGAIMTGEDVIHRHARVSPGLRPSHRSERPHDDVGKGSATPARSAIGRGTAKPHLHLFETPRMGASSKRQGEGWEWLRPGVRHGKGRCRLVPLPLSGEGVPASGHAGWETMGSGAGQCEPMGGGRVFPMTERPSRRTRVVATASATS